MRSARPTRSRDSPPPGRFRFGPFEFDSISGLLYQGDDETLLPPRVALVLRCLLEGAGRLVTKEQLLEGAWQDASVTDSSISYTISVLRQILGDDARRPTYVETLHGRGYRFVASVERRGSEGARVGDVGARVGKDGEHVDKDGEHVDKDGEHVDKDGAHVDENGAGADQGGARVDATDAQITSATASTGAPGGSLAPGDRLGSYQILDVVGAGATGTVYRARDDALEREVAIKLLADDLADDPDRLARLEREAKLLAALSHPNIATIHALEEAHGRKLPVLEFVDGETLDERIRSRPPTVVEALRIARDIASALEAAHERGIIHRDLKPSNVKLTPQGQVKVLDFGLAKRLEVEILGEQIGASPTTSLTVRGRRGSIVGTAAYMSPEQARGLEVDKRADIWSFGCVLYELLTGGARAFGGDTIADTLAMVVGGEPDWTALPAETPRSIRSLLRRCLRKEPSERLRDIGDARIEIDDALAAPAAGLAPTPGRSGGLLRRRSVDLVRLLAAAAVVTIAVVLAAAITGGLPSSRELDPLDAGAFAGGLSFVHELPEGQWLFHHPPAAITVSPDGTRFVYEVTDGQQRWLALRSLGETEARRIPGTEAGALPFFSPDGASVAFLVPGELVTVRIEGGSPQPVVSVPDLTGISGSWGDDGTIVLGGVQQRLAAVPATGGPLEFLTELREGTRERVHVHPHVLPGGDNVLFGVADRYGMHLETLDRETEERKLILPDVGRAWYVSAGYLVFVQQHRLMAIAFDAEALEVRGQAFAVETGVAGDWLYKGASADVARSGAIAYVSEQTALPRDHLVLRTRGGGEVELTEQRRGWAMARFAPAGDDLLVLTEELHDLRLWVTEADRFSPRSIRLPPPPRAQASTRRDETTAAAEGFVADAEPPGPGGIWHPSGDRLTVRGFGPAGLGVYSLPLDQSTRPELLFAPPAPGAFVPISWSADGRSLVLNRWRAGIGWDMWILDAEQESPRRFGNLEVEQVWHGPGGSLSPGGDWIAYQAMEGGRSEIWVQPFPQGGRPHPVTTQGGQWPHWSAQGDEIFFVRGDKMMAVPVQTEPELAIGEPSELFSGPYVYYLAGGINAYDVSPDGRSFILIERGSEPGPTSIVYSWHRFWQRDDR